MQKASDYDPLRSWFVWLQTFEVLHAIHSAGNRVRGIGSANRGRAARVPSSDGGYTRGATCEEVEAFQAREASRSDVPPGSPDSGPSGDAPDPGTVDAGEGQRGGEAPHGEAAPDAEEVTWRAWREKTAAAIAFELTWRVPGDWHQRDG